MSRSFEIGSNFWLSQEQLKAPKAANDSRPFGLESWRSCILTSSGRGALRLLLRNLKGVKKVLLPIYTCDTCIIPFDECGISYDFYSLRKDFTIDVNELFSLIETTHYDLIYLQTYYGFDTLKELRPLYSKLQSIGIIIVEDITHSWLSSFDSSSADYVLLSMRKWMEIPDGGALLSNIHELPRLDTMAEADVIVNDFLSASELKEEYFITHDPETKAYFRDYYVKAEIEIDTNQNVYTLSSIAATVLQNSNFDFIRNRRRANYEVLTYGLKNENIEVVCPSLPSKVVPLYCPIYVNENRRILQQKLAQHNIYCPVHWPIPQQVESLMAEEERYIYDHVLSLVCDQRYSDEDMDAIIEIINNN